MFSEKQKLKTTSLHLLTYLLTPGSRVLLGNLTAFQLVKKVPRILWHPKVHHRSHKSPPSVPITSLLHLIKTTRHEIMGGAEISPRPLTSVVNNCELLVGFMLCRSTNSPW
jgi:hypothetical protein